MLSIFRTSSDIHIQAQSKFSNPALVDANLLISARASLDLTGANTVFLITASLYCMFYVFNIPLRTQSDTGVHLQREIGHAFPVCALHSV